MDAAPLPPPAHATWRITADGVRLYTSIRLPAGEPVGIVYLVLGPECGAAPPYPALTAALLEAGFAVALLHPRGTGRSDGRRGDVDDVARFVDDHRLGLADLRARFGARPLFLLGQSVGAAYALELAAHTDVPPSGLVLVNPAYKLLAAEGMTPTWRDLLTFAVNAVFRPAVPTVDMNRRPSAIRHPEDRAEAEAMQADPLVVRFFSLRLLWGQRRIMRRCPRNAAATSSPLLIVEGARDVLVDPRGTAEILAAAVGTDKALIVASEGGHGASAVETQVRPIVDWLVRRGASSEIRAHREVSP